MYSSKVKDLIAAIFNSKKNFGNILISKASIIDGLVNKEFSIWSPLPITHKILSLLSFIK